MGTYTFDQSWSEERRRLGSIELTWDPYTIRRIRELGVGAASRCLEVAGGAGSIARWLAGNTASVTATDLDTRFLDEIDAPNVTVQRHDITTDAIEEGAYDFAHARLLLEHLGARDDAVKRMAAALKPGGVLLIEDYDWISGLTAMPENPVMTKVTTTTLELMTRNGYDAEYGRKLPETLAAHGFEDVHLEGVVLMLDPSSPAQGFYRLTLEQLRVPLVASGLLTEAEIQTAIELLGDPSYRSLSPVMMQVSGRKPA